MSLFKKIIADLNVKKESNEIACFDKQSISTKF